MQPSDRAEFVQLLTQCLGFYGHALSPFAIGVWWQACDGFELEQVRKALTAHAMDPERGQWAPKPADVVRVLRGTHADRSLVAWGKVLDAIKRVGAYSSVVFDDGVIHAAIEDMGGWPALCRTGEDELPFLQRRFCDTYRSYSARGDVRYPARLIGEHEATNRLRGHKSAPPAIVGDPARARLVHSSGGDARGKTAIALEGVLPSEREVATR